MHCINACGVQLEVKRVALVNSTRQSVYNYIFYTRNISLIYLQHLKKSNKTILKACIEFQDVVVLSDMCPCRLTVFVPCAVWMLYSTQCHMCHYIIAQYSYSQMSISAKSRVTQADVVFTIVNVMKLLEFPVKFSIFIAI